MVKKWNKILTGETGKDWKSVTILSLPEWLNSGQRQGSGRSILSVLGGRRVESKERRLHCREGRWAGFRRVSLVSSRVFVAVLYLQSHSQLIAPTRIISILFRPSTLHCLTISTIPTLSLFLHRLHGFSNFIAFSSFTLWVFLRLCLFFIPHLVMSCI